MLEEINNDLKNSMRSKDSLRISVLRMFISSIKNKQIEFKKKELSEEEELSVLKSEIKKRKDSILAYEEGARLDLAKKEQDEIEILSAFMPEQMSEEDVRTVVKEVTGGMDGNANFGQVMGAAMSRLKGKADGQLVSKIVKELLSS